MPEGGGGYLSKVYVCRQGEGKGVFEYINLHEPIWNSTEKSKY